MGSINSAYKIMQAILLD